jgi:hypothetical protein
LACYGFASSGAVFSVTDTNDDGGPGTLRVRIEQANASTNPGLNQINFAIPGTGPFRIAIGDSITNEFTPLPPITSRVVIDGYSQSGAKSNTLAKGDNAVLMIELDGTFGGSAAPGLYILGGSCTVRGLVINRFEGPGIRVGGAGGNIIEGNFIGTDVTGTQVLGNQGGGILAISSSNLIGGATSDKRNLISGNVGDGIEIHGGVNLVQNNLIGTDSTGAPGLANSGDGILIAGADNRVGGLPGEPANTIAFNQGHGVVITNGPGNAILGNSIYSNALSGISLGGGSGTTNDPLDTDSGPNNFQNYPLLTSAVASNGIVIAGLLASAPTSRFRIELFSTPGGRCNGEGQQFLGALTDVRTDPSGNATFATNIPVSAQPGDTISATATDPAGNTSEFSPCQSVIIPPSITGQPVSITNLAGTTAVFMLTVAGTSPFTYQWRFNGASLSGANGPVLSLTNVQVGDAGPYTVVVSNSAGSVTSQVATLTVLAPPFITAQPQSQSILERSGTVFSVTATGTAPLSYQWQFNGGNIGGATGSALVLTNVLVSQAGNYRVVVTNVAGSVTSVVAILTVSPVLRGSWSGPLTKCCGFTGTLEAYIVLRGSFSVTNQGGVKVPSTVVKFYVSTNSILDPGDRQVGKAAWPALAPHATRTMRFRGNLPPGMIATGNYLFAVVDATHRVSAADIVVPFGVIP